MNQEIVESFAQMARDKGIDRDILIGIIEDIFGMMVKKKYGTEARFEVVVNMDKGDIEIYLEKQVVEKVEDPITQISVDEAEEKSGDRMEVGEDFVEVIPMTSFGRRLVITAKQNLNQKIKEIEREILFNEYSNDIGNILIGEIYQIRKPRGDVLVIHNKNELMLPRSEQIPKERLKKGDTVRAVIKEVKKGNGSPMVIISRTDPRFLMRLFEIEIPEVYDGIIEIKAISREPGDRAKVAVLSHDDRIDAVGACVGMKGIRIHSVVRELGNENIDVINWSDDPAVLIARALAPAKVLSVELVAEEKRANVMVVLDQKPLAIGKNGLNVKLASKLTEYDIQVQVEGGEEEVEEEYDMELAQFREELGETLFHQFFDEGYSTARSILDAPKGEIIEAIGIDPEKLDEVLEIVRKGFEEAEIENQEDEEAGTKTAELKDPAEDRQSNEAEETSEKVDKPSE
jgi:N utilization substance protein A